MSEERLLGVIDVDESGTTRLIQRLKATIADLAANNAELVHQVQRLEQELREAKAAEATLAQTVSERDHWAAEANKAKAEFDEFRSLSASMAGERFAELRVEQDSLQSRLDAVHVALLKAEEIVSRPSVANEERMSMVWQIVVSALSAFDDRTSTEAKKQ